MSVPFAAQPDAQGRFGPYGGRYVPETLMDALRQLTEEYEKAREIRNSSATSTTTCIPTSAGRRCCTSPSG